MYAWCQDMPGVSAEDYAELMANLGGAEKEADEDPIQPCGRRLGKLGVLDLNQRLSRTSPTIRGGRLSCSCR